MITVKSGIQLAKVKKDGTMTAAELLERVAESFLIDPESQTLLDSDGNPLAAEARVADGKTYTLTPTATVKGV